MHWSLHGKRGGDEHERAVQAEAPEVAAVVCAVAEAGGVGEFAAACRRGRAAHSPFDQQLVVEARSFARRRRSAVCERSQGTAVGGDAHGRLRDRSVTTSASIKIRCRCPLVGAGDRRWRRTRYSSAGRGARASRPLQGQRFEKASRLRTNCSWSLPGRGFSCGTTHPRIGTTAFSRLAWQHGAGVGRMTSDVAQTYFAMRRLLATARGWRRRWRRMQPSERSRNVPPYPMC